MNYPLSRSRKCPSVFAYVFFNYSCAARVPKGKGTLQSVIGPSTVWLSLISEPLSSVTSPRKRVWIISSSFSRLAPFHSNSQWITLGEDTLPLWINMLRLIRVSKTLLPLPHWAHLYMSLIYSTFLHISHPLSPLPQLPYPSIIIANIRSIWKIIIQIK